MSNKTILITTHNYEEISYTKHHEDISHSQMILNVFILFSTQQWQWINA